MHPSSHEAFAGCKFCASAIADPGLILEADSGTRAVASFGAFITGWTLLIPPQHVSSTACLKPDDWASLKALSDVMIEKLNAVFGPVVMFEHGAAGFSRAAGCGVDHAHLHLVPSEFDLRLAIAELGSEHQGTAWESCPGRPVHREDQDYIWIIDSTGSWVQYSDRQPSQLVRQALARKLSITEWDWKRDLRLPQVREGRLLISQAIFPLSA